MRKPFKKELTSIPLEDAHGGSGKRRLVLSATDDISKQLEAFANTYLQPGSKFDWHTHESIDEFLVIISGVGRVLFKDGSVFDYKEKDMIYIPADVEHMIEAASDQDSEFFFIRVRV
ncbi:MAG: hypothetical protein A2233_02050 [Candidatus Kerfeldbacteria bacterium RIFOXYA2_FULL_38_24]|uniref:Cupin type-2 domain-containing protein n=1 Tax=Candidatus Kerfeldbacteria bacterium RIFOXYB2_FULL_38_14 TaxID=1798547 RepID=A0A1G2BEP7_9BACT|nr:MAG: hypothetical protein A2319_04650 [Candidatus Kerfeldbacteria bacterium RIFOXYB2_FULL_38_14]OGY87898.1 MAG: hypothetical protein A2233_02050 [Candidatus Kerfeldbacteria bacterium RIFOXYA2_FULL_38_24]OGY88687.1 MAG: hypothetical protein A2458_03555 [Candidatus Kerfeldbacteria bacterium RIFOXYC2_FULL_38_9]